MSEKRATKWVIALAAACAVYFVSVMVSGTYVRNGAWLLVVLIVLGVGVDALAGLMRAMRRDARHGA